MNLRGSNGSSNVSIDVLMDALAERIASRAAELFAEKLATAAGEASTPPRLLSTSELAREERVSNATIGRLVAAGGPCVYVGASRRFDLAAWRAWIAERGNAPARTRSEAEPVPGVRLVSGARRTGGAR